MSRADKRGGLKKRSQFFKRKRATVTRTFRIDADWDEVLKGDAERQGISVNVLMNLILRKYANFDRLCLDRNSISMPKLGFRKLIENMPAEHLAKAGEVSGSKEIQSILDMQGLPSNYESFRHLVEKFYGGNNCATWFNCYYHPQQTSDLFHFQHHLGREWSIYLEKYFLSYLKMLKMDCKTRVYEYAVNIRVYHQR